MSELHKMASICVKVLRELLDELQADVEAKAETDEAADAERAYVATCAEIKRLTRLRHFEYARQIWRDRADAQIDRLQANSYAWRKSKEAAIARASSWPES